VKREIKIFDDNPVDELQDGQPVLAINPESKVQRLIEALQFTRAETFTVELSEVSFGNSVSVFYLNSESCLFLKLPYNPNNTRTSGRF
jgi:hypothetical protein